MLLQSVDVVSREVLAGCGERVKVRVRVIDWLRNVLQENVGQLGVERWRLLQGLQSLQSLQGGPVCVSTMAGEWCSAGLARTAGKSGDTPVSRTRRGSGWCLLISVDHPHHHHHHVAPS